MCLRQKDSIIIHYLHIISKNHCFPGPSPAVTFSKLAAMLNTLYIHLVVS